MTVRELFGTGRTGIRRVGLGALAASLCAAGACSASMSKPFTATETLTLSASAAGVRVLHVTNSVGDITIRADPGATEILAKVVKKTHGTTQEVADAALRELVVSIRASAGGAEGIAATATYPTPQQRDRQYNAAWTITAPPGLIVKVTDDVGDVRVEGFAGGVTIRTDVGDAVVKNVQGGADVRTDVGDVIVEAAGKIVASADVGDVTVRLMGTEAASVTANADVGDVVVTLPSIWAGKIDSSTDVGRVRTELGALTLANVVKKGGRFAAEVGGGGAAVVSAKSDVGSVEIRVAPAAGDAAP